MFTLNIKICVPNDLALLDYLGAFNPSTFSCPTEDLPLVTHAELAICDVPHVSMVTDCILVQAASLGSYTLLTALTYTPHVGLTLERQMVTFRKGLAFPFSEDCKQMRPAKKKNYKEPKNTVVHRKRKK